MTVTTVGAHKRRATQFVEWLTSRGYQAVLDSDHEIAESEYSPKGNPSIVWLIQPGRPNYPNETPWYYSHCYLMVSSDGGINDTVTGEMHREWEKLGQAFPNAVRDEGAALAKRAIAAHKAHKTESEYVVTSEFENSFVTESLGYADGYWLSVVVSEGKEGSSTLSIAFTPQIGPSDFRAPPRLESK